MTTNFLIAAVLTLFGVGYLWADQQLRFSRQARTKAHVLCFLVFLAVIAILGNLQESWTQQLFRQAPLLVAVGAMMICIAGAIFRDWLYPLERDYRRLAVACARHLLGESAQGLDLGGLFQDHLDDQGVSEPDWEDVRSFLMGPTVGVNEETAQDCIAWHSPKKHKCPFPDEWALMDD